MVTGWLQADDGNWYYFESQVQESLGQMRKGCMVTIGGKQYIFAANGALYINTTTEDGYRTNEYGQVVSKIDAYGKMRLV